MPPIKSDNVPEVSLDATTTRKIESMPANRTSAIELLSQSRIGEIIQIPVTETKFGSRSVPFIIRKVLSQ